MPGFNIRTNEKYPCQMAIDLDALLAQGIEKWKEFISDETTKENVKQIYEFFNPTIASIMHGKYIETVNIVKQWIYQKEKK